MKQKKKQKNPLLHERKNDMKNNSSKLSFGEKLKNRISVFKENNPSAFVFVMIIVVNIISVIISSLLLIFLPENKGRSFSEMMRFAFTLMINPSGRYQYSDYPASLIITTVVVLLGMISLTGGTVGYITSVINNILEKSANSKNSLNIKNHIVILNYNHKVPSLIYDYCFDDIGSTYIVILADKDKNEIENQINNIFSSNNMKNKFKNIIIRKGSPMSKLDLDNISMDTAKTVLLMTPENDSPVYGNAADDNQSFAVSKLFMFITWYFQNKETSFKPNIIVEAPNSNVEEMVRDYHLENINQVSVPVNFNEVLGKILAVTSIMPSLNDVLLHMISFEGVEIYLKENPKSISVSEELQKHKSATPLFDIDGMRVYIAENEDAISDLKTTAHKLSKPLPDKKFVPCISIEKSEIIIIGINSKLGYILDSLVCFKNEYPEMDFHVILMDTEENKNLLENYYSDSRYASILNSENDQPIIIHDIFNPLRDLDMSVISRMNSMLFLSDENNSSDHIDEKPLLFWSKLKDIENINARDCIVEVLDMQNKDIIERKNKDQVIISDKFLSCMYAQLGKDPLRLDAIKDIITFENDEASKNSENQFANRCNLFAVKAETFFKNYSGKPEFESKRELISWVYEATEHEYMPIGCIKNGVNYLFARTDGRNDDLDTAVLLPKDESSPLRISEKTIRFDKDDEIIVLKYNK